MRTFWDLWAPFYDLAEKTNGRVYNEMLKTVREFVPQGASVLEAAAGTGSISLAIADKASRVLCTDLSEKMLNVVRRKMAKHNVKNVTIDMRNIHELHEPDSSFDVIIAGQVLHLIDEPEKAAAELRRVAKTMIILPMSFTENLRGTAKFSVSFFRLLGVSLKREFNAEGYKTFLQKIGFDNCEHIQIAGKIPMAVAIWRKG